MKPNSLIALNAPGTEALETIPTAKPKFDGTYRSSSNTTVYALAFTFVFLLFAAFFLVRRSSLRAVRNRSSLR